MDKLEKFGLDINEESGKNVFKEKQIFKAIGKLELRPTKSGEKFYVMKRQKKFKLGKNIYSF